jgi:hypothetical protein
MMMTASKPEKIPFPVLPLNRGNRERNSFWPPSIVWALERGWLNVQDPADGTWFSIPARQAPTGWARIATAAKTRQGVVQRG